MAEEPNLQEQDPGLKPVTVSLPDAADGAMKVETVIEKPKKITSPPAGPRARWRDDETDTDRLPENVRQVIRRAEWKRHEAERHVDNLLAENARLKAHAGAADAFADDAALAHAKAELTTAEAALTAAIEAGDVKAQVAASSAVARWAPEAARLDAAVSRRKTAAAAGNGRDNDGPRHADGDPDAGVHPRMHPKAEAWMRDNQDLMSDPADSAIAQSLSMKLVAEGYDVGSDEHYEQLDARLAALGLKEARGDPDPDGGNSRQTDRLNDGGRGTATPPTRGEMGNKAPAGSATSVTLSSEERGLARQMNMTDQAYALGKLRRDGKISAQEHSQRLRELRTKGLA